MVHLATQAVEEPDLLSLIADEHTPLSRMVADRFREACRADAREHDGEVNPNRVRERLLVGGVLDIEPRKYSSLWSTACARGGYLEKTKEWRPIEGEGSRGNGNKSVLLRRWVGEPL